MNNKVIEWKAPEHESSRNEEHCNSNKATKTANRPDDDIYLLDEVRGLGLK